MLEYDDSDVVDDTSDLETFIAYLKEEDTKNKSETTADQTADTVEIKPDQDEDNMFGAL
jgi:hypothetical protein